MKTLIIGGTKFIGRHLTELLLNSGHEVKLFHRGETNCSFSKDVEYINGDRKDLQSFKSKLLSHKFDYVVDMIPMNDEDTKAVVEIFKGNINQSVHIVSQDVYNAWDSVLSGIKSYATPIDETYPLRERKYPYKGRMPGRENYDKTLVEGYLAFAYKEYKFPYSTIRFPKTYGEYDGQQRFYSVVKRILDGRKSMLVSDEIYWNWTDGYVRDLVYGIMLALTKKEAIGESYNIGNQKVRTVAQTIEKIADLMNGSLEIKHVPDWFLPRDKRSKSFFAQHLMSDSSKIRNQLGYKEHFTLDEGFLNTIAWTKSNPPKEWKEDFTYEEEDKLIQEFQVLKQQYENRA